VFFNDSTKIVLDMSGVYFEYMERKPDEKQDIVQVFNIGQHPNELQKKVTLL